MRSHRMKRVSRRTISCTIIRANTDWDKQKNEQSQHNDLIRSYEQKKK